MKMLKKAAAVLLAAAMSLTMLTACGGGSGSGTAATSGTYTMKTTVVEVNGVAPTKTETVYETTNGTWFYSESTYGTEVHASLSNAKGEHYTINPTTKKAYKESESEASGSNKDDIAEPNATITTSTGTWKYNDKTYTTEEMTIVYPGADGYKVVVARCYDGAQLAYIKSVTTSAEGTYTEIERVLEYSKTADESKLNPNNYELVEKREDLF